MKLLCQKTVETELDVLATVPAYNVILLAREVPDTEPGHVLYQSLVHHPKGIEGKAPHEFKYMSKCTNMPSPLSTLNGQQFCKMYEFLNNNGKYHLIPTAEDGDCLFGAFRRCTTLPAECADAHIRRVIIKVISHSHQFFFNLFKRSIAATYGLDRDTPEQIQQKIASEKITEQELREANYPGPFSFHSWLRFMLKNSSYGDAMIVMAMSMLWNLKITVLNAERLFEIRFRHNSIISKADMVLVQSSETEHYITAGKRP